MLRIFSRSIVPATRSFGLRGLTPNVALRVFPFKAPKPPQIRYYCAPHRPAPLTVDQVLRKFYSITHPDRFHQEPEKQKVNQNSFALLQNYLNLMKAKGRHDGDHAPFTLSFYTTSAKKMGVIKVVPPTPETPPEKYGVHLHRTLSSLFTSCGFDYPPFDVSEYGKGPTAEFYATQPGDVTLINFLVSTAAQRRSKSKERKQALAEEAIQLETRSKHLNELIRSIISKYKLGKIEFGVKDHLFQSPFDRASTRIGLIQKFEQTLTVMGDCEHLRGASIIFKKTNWIDDEKNILLDHSEPIDEWVKLLQSYTPKAVSDIIAKAKSRVELENKLAEQLGIASFKADQELSRSLAYRSLLGQLLSKKFPKLEKMKKLKARVVSNASIDVERSTGTVLIPLIAQPSAVFEMLLENGELAVEQASIFLYNLEHLSRLFGCVSLTHSPPPELKAEELSACIDRLHKHQNSFLPYFQGLKIHVTNFYGYNPEADIFAIRWDFMIDKPKQ